MKIELKNCDAELDLRAGPVNIRTGAEGGLITLAPGQKASIEITDEDHLFAAPVGPSRPESGQSQPAAPALIATDADNRRTGSREEPLSGDPALLDPTDENIEMAIRECMASNAETTASGAIELAALNAELKNLGLAPVTAKRRDEVSKAMLA